MHVRSDNQYKTEADGGTILGQSMLFECMGICVLSPAHESEMRGYLVYLLIVKYLSILFKFSHSMLDWTALSCFVFFSFFLLFFFFWGGEGGGGRWDVLKKFKWCLLTIIIYRDYIIQ